MNWPVRVQGGLNGAEAWPVRHNSENVEQLVGLSLVSREGLLFKLQFPRPCEVHVGSQKAFPGFQENIPCFSIRRALHSIFLLFFLNS